MNILYSSIMAIGSAVTLSIQSPVQLPEINHVSLTLEEQSTGQYFYAAIDAHEQYILVRKAGHSVIGVDGRRSQKICFRGFLDGNRIVNAMRVFPPYAPDSRWESSRSGEFINLSHYLQLDQSPTEDQAASLKPCLEFFSR
jgi:hypothetical protein